MSKTYVTVSRVAAQGMITVRGDMAEMAEGVKTAVGLDMPGQMQVVGDAQKGIAWMSPDEVLILADHGATAGVLTDLGKALSGLHHLAVDVSDARAVFTLNGAKLREVLAKLTPTDTHPDHLGVGDFRRTRFGQVAGAFWLTSETTATILCFRSVADYMEAMLNGAANTDAQVYEG